MIFISIDDNEVHRLRMMMDEVFGEANFVAQITWQKVYSPRMDAKAFSQDHDHIVMYCRSDEFTVGKISFEQNVKQFTGVESSGERFRLRSLRKEGKNSRREDRPNLFYPLEAPDGTIIYPIRSDGSEGCWRWEKKKYDRARELGIVEWTKSEVGWQVYVKQYLAEEAVKPPSTLWLHTEVGHNHRAVEELKSMFGKAVFDSPKPVALVKQILTIGSDQNSIILDSFAGSGTTAQAVLALNAEDGGNRKFILVEQEDYADNVTAERVRRVIRGVPDAKDEQLRNGLGGTFSYIELGEEYSEARLLGNGKLPSYEDLARYVFFTATGEQWDATQMDKSRWYLDESLRYKVYLYFTDDVEQLKNMPLNLSFVKDVLGEDYRRGDKPRLVIAALKYLDEDAMRYYGVEYCQLPFGIYKFKV